MKIGIIGADDRAVAIGRLLAQGGHDVTLSDPKNPDHAKAVAPQVPAEPEIPYRQAMTRDVVFIACERGEVDRAVTAMGSSADAIIVDATEGPKPAAGPSGAEILAHKLDSHNVVRAMIVLPQTGANVPICGDDEIAKTIVGEVLQSSGCVTTDRGTLANAAELEAGVKA